MENSNRTENYYVGGIKIASAINAVIGLWLIVSPFVLGYARVTSVMIDTVIVGVIVLVIETLRVMRPRQAATLSWATALLGLWLIVSLWFLGLARIKIDPFEWSFSISAIMLFVGGAFSASYTMAQMHLTNAGRMPAKQQ